MGLEFLFSPRTVVAFFALILTVVLLQRLLFRAGFLRLGIRRVALAYFMVMATSLVAGALSVGGMSNEWLPNALIATYVATTFVTLALLPVSLCLLSFGRLSGATVFTVGGLLALMITGGMVALAGRKLLERGSASLLPHVWFLIFLLAVSAGFAVALGGLRSTQGDQR